MEVEEVDRVGTLEGVRYTELCFVEVEEVDRVGVLEGVRYTELRELDGLCVGMVLVVVRLEVGAVLGVRYTLLV